MHPIWLHGNHDDPAYFNEERIHYTRWRAIPDYSVISANEHHILCIGGATSIDRSQRMKENVRYHVKDVSYYWPDEAPVFDEKAIESIPEDVKIDSVITKIFHCIKNYGHPLEKWFYGHFHQSWTVFLHGTLYSMLDIMEFKELR